MYTSPVLKQKILKAIDVEKSKAQITVEIIEYVPNSKPVETIIKKSSGKISTMLVDNGEVLTEKTYPFETYAQVIDGITEIVIAGEAFYLGTGQSIVIPPHAPNYIRPFGGFKMIMSMVKNGEF